MYPSEYAYCGDSVNRAETVGANCRRYPSGLQDIEFTSSYIHCDGNQLKLTDSDLGQERYNPNDYYAWPAGGDGQLLFIFHTRVSFTTITLHYYSDSDRGLPRLGFYAVSDDFDVWELPTASRPRVDVASVLPGGEPAGQRSVSINVNFNTKRILMCKSSSTFQLAVSEVKFFKRKHVVMCTTFIRQYFNCIYYVGNDTTASTAGSLVSSESSPHNHKTTAVSNHLTTVEKCKPHNIHTNLQISVYINH